MCEQRPRLVRLPGCFGALGPACPLKAASCAAHHSPSRACGDSFSSFLLSSFLSSPLSWPLHSVPPDTSRAFLRFRRRKCFPPASRKVSGCLAASPCSLGAPEPQCQMVAVTKTRFPGFQGAPPPAPPRLPGCFLFCIFPVLDPFAGSPSPEASRSQ